MFCLVQFHLKFCILDKLLQHEHHTWINCPLQVKNYLMISKEKVRHFPPSLFLLYLCLNYFFFFFGLFYSSLFNYFYLFILLILLTGSYCLPFSLQFKHYLKILNQVNQIANIMLSRFFFFFFFFFGATYFVLSIREREIIIIFFFDLRERDYCSQVKAKKDVTIERYQFSILIISQC